MRLGVVYFREASERSFSFVFFWGFSWVGVLGVRSWGFDYFICGIERLWD